MMTFEDLIQAYTDCRRHKRSGREALAFEVGLEDNLMALWRELRAGTYRPGRSRCFIIGRPVRREVFAAEFRDRVVQHLLVNRIEPVLDRGMIHDSYSCRKGTGYVVRRAAHPALYCAVFRGVYARLLCAQVRPAGLFHEHRPRAAGRHARAYARAGVCGRR